MPIAELCRMARWQQVAQANLRAVEEDFVAPGVGTCIHHPTDSTLLGDGVRVLTRLMKKITKIAGAAGTKLRDRTRSVKLRLLEIGRVARSKGPVRQDKLMQHYRRLLDATSRAVGQAKRFSKEIAQGVKRSRSFLKQLALEGFTLPQSVDGNAENINFAPGSS